MAAKLEWQGKGPFTDDLCLGGWILAEVYRVGERRGSGRHFRWSTTSFPLIESGPMETFADAKQDCETEVRRLLKEAGVNVDG